MHGTHFRHISTNVQHRNAAKGGAPEQSFSAADLLNDVECECAHAESLCDTVETSGEQLSRGSNNPQCFKDARGIISDNVLKHRLVVYTRYD
jgi:hypothetical protein